MTMKTAILDCHDDSYEHIAKLCRKSKASYCSLKGMDFIEFKFKDIRPYGSTWGRLFGIEIHLPDYEWILYLDTDVMITNPDFDLASLMDDRFNIVLGRMPDFLTGIPNHISTSSLLLRNDPWTFEFIKLWKGQTRFISEPYHAEKTLEGLSTLGVGGLFYEQSALHYLYDTSEDVRRRIKIVDGLNDREVTHGPKSFLIHFARSPKEKRIRSFAKKLIKV
jgi:hypothetical protein